MKLVSADAQVIVFRLSHRERGILIPLLRTYPIIPSTHYAISRKANDSRVAEQQRLLEEALAEQRTKNKRRLDAWLTAPKRFQETPDGIHLALDRSDVEWFLQLLNDIRVGHWIQLGSPELEKLDLRHFAPGRISSWLAMEMSGYLQMSVLRALES
jgi:hypothetical protein